MVDFFSDEDYIIERAKDAQYVDINSAKAWMLTAKTLFPNNFKIQFEAYLMEKQSGNVTEAAECFSSLLASRMYISSLLPEIGAIANALKTNDNNFLSQMFDKLCSDMQLAILKTSIENSDNTMEHCKLLALLLKKFPQLGVDSLVKTLINSEKFLHDNSYTRLLIVDTLPLLNSLESPRLLQRLLVKAIDFYSTYVYDDLENDIIDPWPKLYEALDLLGRQLGWDSYLMNYSNTHNKEKYLQNLMSLRNLEDCRQLLYCGTAFLLQSLYEQKPLKSNHVLIESLCDPDVTHISTNCDIIVTGTSAEQFQCAANCWELLHSNEVITREFNRLASQLKVKPWSEQFLYEHALYGGNYEEALAAPIINNLSSQVVKVSLSYVQKKIPECIEHILSTIKILPHVEGTTEMDLIVKGSGRHIHFLPLTRSAITHYFCTLLIRILANSGTVTDQCYGHMLVLMQLGWPQEESVFIHILNAIKQKKVFQYHLFINYIVQIDILEEFYYMWNDQSNNAVLDIVPNSQQMLGQRRIGTRGSDKGVKEDFKQAIRGQVSRSNESITNLILQFITQEKTSILTIINC